MRCKCATRVDFQGQQQAATSQWQHLLEEVPTTKMLVRPLCCYQIATSQVFEIHGGLGKCTSLDMHVEQEHS